MTDNASTTPARKRRTTAAKADSKAHAPARRRSGRDEAGQGPKRGRSMAAPAPETAPTPDPAQVEAERVAERCANAKRALDAAPGWVDVITRATEELDDDAARAAADELIATARAVRRALSARKSGGTIGPRTPKGEGRYQLVAEDGTVVKASNYRPSVSRDRSQAKRRIALAEARPGDEALAAAELVDTQAEPVTA
jgi:hypothetical protein